MYTGNEPITNGITEGVEGRKQRGMEIAAVAKITWTEDFYVVPSQSSGKRYTVKYGKATTCTCPDHETRRCKCKHIYAVEYFIRREQGITASPDGVITKTDTLTIEARTRKTYPQNWAAYNDAQQNEKREFQKLLHDLCKGVAEPVADKPRRGRPALKRADAIFAAVFKVYSTMSARRFTSDLCDAQAKGYIDKVPHFNSVLNTLEDAELYPVLLDMIVQASLPLRSVETDFAVDSTGFTSCRFARWYDVKYKRIAAEQQWVKAHLMCGVKTNVITAIEIHGRNAGDAPILPSLVDSTARNFTLAEVSADKGYTGAVNHEAIARHGATPYIAFKMNANGRVGGTFEKMFHYFQFNREDFLAHYHKRSNVESTVMMVKSKFGDSLRSKTETAMRNETLCKVLCHNICCLISAMYELAIQVDLSGQTVLRSK